VYVGLCKHTFAQRRNRLTKHFSERIPVVKRRISVHFVSGSVTTSDAERDIAHSLLCSTSANVTGRNYVRLSGTLFWSLWLFAFFAWGL